MKHKLLIVALSLVVPALHAGLGSVPKSSVVRGSLLLTNATLQGNASQVEALLARGVSPNEVLRPGLFPIILAAGEGHEVIVRALLRAGAEVNVAGNKGLTPLIAAVALGHERIVRLLLAAGANSNFVPRDGDATPLVGAVEGRHEGIVADLLRAGALTEVVDRGEGAHGFTPLVVAVNDRTVHDRSCNDGIIHRLLRAGANPNATSATLRGITPLMSASDFGCATLMRRLLAFGASINATSDDGMTALMIAAMKGQEEAVRVLLAAGADCTIADSDGDTALTLALRQRHEAIVCLLGEQIEGH